MVEKRGDLQVRPFQGLKLAILHVSDLLPSFFEKKSYETEFIFGKHTCMNMRFRACNAS